MIKSPVIKLKRNEDGYPILPSLEEIDRHGLIYKKRLVGKFMADVYGSWAVYPCCRFSHLANF
jgi:hypothetical protein